MQCEGHIMSLLEKRKHLSGITECQLSISIKLSFKLLLKCDFE